MVVVSSELEYLVVLDDDPMICAFVKQFAESAGFRVVSFTDPLKFTDFYSAKTDLILLDLNMPIMDGIEVLRFLGDNRSKAAIVIISGDGEEINAAARSLAIRQGLNNIGTLQKPFDQDDLKRMLEIAYEDADGAPSRVIPKGTMELPSEEELREAIMNDLLEVYFQPKVHLLTKTVVGAEALVRWQHSKKGFVPPDYFVTLAEQSNLINNLTNFVFKKVCQYLKKWLIDKPYLKISVNVSDLSLGDLDFPEFVMDYIKTGGLNTSNIILELTETSISSDTTRVMDILTRLRLKGFELSIDDFGTGHSSLQRLNEMPFSELKIDQSFVGKAHTESGARTIVKNTIELGASLGMKTVGEGAETQEHIDILEEFGCDIVQGYFISRPLPPKDFEEWLKEQK